jgi:sec-independent protein translocase protein TatA
MFDMLAMFESPSQWLIILVIILLLFGGSRIPEMMRGLGSGMREFKKGLNESDDEKSEAKKQAAKSEGDKTE